MIVYCILDMFAIGMEMAYLVCSSKNVRRCRFTCDEGGDIGPLLSLRIVSPGMVLVVVDYWNRVRVALPV